MFVNLRREWNEYRIGGDVDVAGFKFTLLRRWDFYKEDSLPSVARSNAAAIGLPDDLTVRCRLSSRRRRSTGANPGWLGNLVTVRKRWSVNARASYLMGRNNFTMNEIFSGVGRLGADVNRQILVQGDAERPVVTGDLNLDVQPSDRLTIVNNTSVQQSADQRTLHLHGDPQRQRFGHDDQLPVSWRAARNQFDGRTTIA